MAAAETKVTAPAEANTAHAEGERQERGDRGERGGRRRGGRNRHRDGRERGPRHGEQGEILLPPPISIEEAMAPVAPRAARIDVAAPTAPAITPVADTVTAPEHAPAQVSTAAPQAEAAAAVPAPRPAPALSPAMEPEAVKRSLEATGLQLIETRGKSEVVPEPEFVPAKRTRRPPPSALNEPLMQVETSKQQLSQP